MVCAYPSAFCPIGSFPDFECYKPYCSMMTAYSDFLHNFGSVLRKLNQVLLNSKCISRNYLNVQLSIMLSVSHGLVKFVVNHSKT